MNVSTALVLMPVWANFANFTSIVVTFALLSLLYLTRSSFASLVSISCFVAKRGARWMSSEEEEWLDVRCFGFAWPLFVGAFTTCATIFLIGADHWAHILTGQSSGGFYGFYGLVAFALVVALQSFQSMRFVRMFGRAGLAGAVPCALLGGGCFAAGILLGPVALMICILSWRQLIPSVRIFGVMPGSNVP